MNTHRRPRHLRASFLATALVALTVLGSPAPAQQPGSSPVKLYLMLGQSNMEGQGEISPAETPGTLEYIVANDPGSDYQFLVDGGGGWVVCDDVWIHYERLGGALRTGDLEPGYGASGANTTIGPELGFGHRIGNTLGNQVLLVKAAWGGRSLGNDFLPPSSGADLEAARAYGDPGFYYKETLRLVEDATANLGTRLPLEPQRTDLPAHRPGHGGHDAHAAPPRCPSRLLASSGPGGVTLTWQYGSETPTNVQILRDGVEIEASAPVSPTVYTDTTSDPGEHTYQLVFTMPGDPCDPLTVTHDSGISGLSAYRSQNGVMLGWVNNLGYAAIEVRRDGVLIEPALSGSATSYEDTGTPATGLVTYTVVPSTGTSTPAEVEINLGPVVGGYAAIYEPFDLPAGAPLDGAAGGPGLGAWSGGGTIAPNSLEFGALPVTGNEYTGGGSITSWAGFSTTLSERRAAGSRRRALVQRRASARIEFERLWVCRSFERNGQSRCEFRLRPGGGQCHRHLASERQRPPIGGRGGRHPRRRARWGQERPFVDRPYPGGGQVHLGRRWRGERHPGRSIFRVSISSSRQAQREQP